MSNTHRSKILCSVLAAVALSLVAAPVPIAAAPGDGPVQGSMFTDLSRDGVWDSGESLADTDPLFPPNGISVTAFDPAGNSIAGTVVPGTPPTYSVDPTTLVGQDYRLEFELAAADITAGWTFTVRGADSASSTQFVTAGSTANIGVVPPSSCRNGDGSLFLTCFAINGLTDTVVTMDYDATNKTVNGIEGDTGSVWGTAYDEWTDRLWISSFNRRGYNVGPAGLSGIYSSTAGGGWVGFDLGSSFLGGFNSATATPEQTAAAVGRVGIGDIDLSPNGRSLFVANVATQAVHIYDVTSGTPNIGSEVIVSIPDPGCAATDSYEIFAAKAISNTEALVGAVCTAEGTGDIDNLTAHVFSVTTAGAVGLVPGVASIPLNYERGCSAIGTGCDRFWHQWTNLSSDILASRISAGGAQQANLRQPMFTDIEVGVDGSLIFGFSDRTALQHTGGTIWDDSSVPGNQAVWVNVSSGGDIIRYGNAGSVASPVYVPDAAISTGGGAEHFGWEEELYPGGGHEETASGAAWVHPGLNEVVATVMDPATTNSFGLKVADIPTGNQVAEYQLAGGSYLYKAGGLGDIEGCFKPIEIGDRVWLDLDNDGLQDPDEMALQGVTVTITGGSLPPGGISVQTDANGNWTFDSADGIDPSTSYTITLNAATNTTPLPGGYGNGDLFETVSLAGSDTEIDSNLDGGSFTVTSPASGFNDHSFDAGFSLPPLNDMALEKTLTSFDIDTRTAVFEIAVTTQGGTTEDFTIVDYMNTPTAGVWEDIVLGAVNPNGSTGGDVALPYTWNASNPQQPTISVDGVLATGQTATIPVTLTWTDPLPVGAAINNWAEIASFDDDGSISTPAPSDIDSTPNSNQADDNQPAGPGAPTDGVTDENGLTGGDEDDHDVAGVRWWDLTLIKERSAGQPYVVDYSTSPPTISFDITVGNQGNQVATEIGVTDYLPTGTVYTAGTPATMPTTTSGAAAVVVTDNGDGTFEIDTLAPGDSVTFGIVLDVTDTSLGSFTNGAEIDSFLDADGASQTDIDSTPDATNSDPLLADATNADNPGNSHNDIDYDPDGDGNLSEATAGDEDDHDVEIVVAPFDLAFQKTINAVSSPLFPAGTVTFDLTVTNQGAPVERIELTDYIDSTLFDAITIDGSTNAPGTATGSAANSFGYIWSGDGTTAPSVLITPSTPGDTFTFGETLVVPVTLTVSSSWSGDDLENWAEISLFDDDGTSANGDSAQAGTGAQLVDVDSTPDAIEANDNQPSGHGQTGDDVIDNTGGDEDDHDVAGLPIYDVALIKDLGAGQAYTVDLSTAPPQATFTITLKNQGNHPVTGIEVTEHAPTGTVLDGADTDAANVGVAGLSRAGDVFTIAGPLAAGAEVTFDVVLDITDLNAGPYLNEAEISDVSDSAGNPVTDIDSTPDGTQGNDTIEEVTSVGDPETINSHDDIDNDRTVAGAPIFTANDDDDHGQEQVAVGFDQALQKTLDLTQASLADGVQVGDLITFDLTITNQGAPVQTLEITDYPLAGLTYAAANNANGSVVDSGDADSLTTSWDPTNPVVTVSGDSFDFGETITVPIVLEVDATWPGNALVNWAEISRFDNDQDAANGDSAQAGTGTQLVDIDSTPDATRTNDDQPTGAGQPGDDVIDNTGGDEDDHDVAAVPVWDLHLIKTYATGQGPTVDLSVNPPTISFDITVSNQGSEDAYNVAVMDHIPAASTFVSAVVPAGVTDNADGTFLIDSLPVSASVTITLTLQLDPGNLQEQYINAAEITAFDNDADSGNPLPAYVVDTDSAPSSANTDPVINHNDPAYDPNGDGNLNEPTTGDEDDHDIETVTLPFDLALRKTVDGTLTTFPLAPGSSVTFMIEVINQGSTVERIEVTDYIDSAIWNAFDAVANPAGTTGGDQAYPFTWDASDPLNPVATIVGPVAYSETVTIPVTLTIPADYSVATGPLVNLAEISAFDDDTVPTNPPPTDVDSTPDTTNSDSLIDDEIDNAGGDEDDHDVAGVEIFDLALRKVLDPATVLPVQPAQQVTFMIEVFNQGSTDATTITVTDYVDTTKWEAFDLALNPAGTTTGGVAVPYTWAVAGVNGEVTIAGTIPSGQSVTVPVTVQIASGADLTLLSNTAEITTATATIGGNPVTNADGSPVTDIDSVPDAVDGDVLTDDEIANGFGDEDDHDVALVEPPTYSLGNQIWLDTNNDGMLDPTESPIAGVLVHLFVDGDGDGQPDDTNNDGLINVDDSVAMDIADTDGGYLFTDLATGEYVVGIAPENWAPGAPLHNMLSSDPTEADPNTDLDDDDNGIPCNCSDGYVYSGPVSLAGSEPTAEPGLDNDPITFDANSNLTVDFGFWQPVFDLALRKTLSNGANSASVNVGDLVTYTITVFNQGEVTATNIELIDYLPTGLELVDSDWALGGDRNPRATIAGPLAPGASTTIDLTARVLPAGGLVNTAEITSAAPINSDGSAMVLPSGLPLPDIDSTADATNAETPVDDEINNSGGDEDDHDGATLSLLVQTTTTPPLALTGVNSRTMALAALLLVAIGQGLLMIVPRKRREHF